MGSQIYVALVLYCNFKSVLLRPVAREMKGHGGVLNRESFEEKYDQTLFFLNIPDPFSTISHLQDYISSI